MRGFYKGKGEREKEKGERQKGGWWEIQRIGGRCVKKV